MGRLLCANLATTFPQKLFSRCSAGKVPNVEDVGERNASNLKIARASSLRKTMGLQVVSGTKSAAATSLGWTCEQKGDDRKTFRWYLKRCALNNRW